MVWPTLGSRTAKDQNTTRRPWAHHKTIITLFHGIRMQTSACTWHCSWHYPTLRSRMATEQNRTVASRRLAADVRPWCFLALFSHAVLSCLTLSSMLFTKRPNLSKRWSLHHHTHTRVHCSVYLCLFSCSSAFRARSPYAFLCNSQPRICSRPVDRGRGALGVYVPPPPNK